MSLGNIDNMDTLPMTDSQLLSPVRPLGDLSALADSQTVGDDGQGKTGEEDDSEDSEDSEESEEEDTTTDEEVDGETLVVRHDSTVIEIDDDDLHGSVLSPQKVQPEQVSEDPTHQTCATFAPAAGDEQKAGNLSQGDHVLKDQAAQAIEQIMDSEEEGGVKPNESSKGVFQVGLGQVALGKLLLMKRFYSYMYETNPNSLQFTHYIQACQTMRC